MFKRIIMLLSSIASLLFMFSACSEPEPNQPPIALSIIIGRRAASNEFTDDVYTEIEPWIRRAVYDGYISVIMSDGEPHVIKTYGRDIFPSNARSRQYMNNLINSRTREVINFLRDPLVRAVFNEADTLGSIVQAERSLNAVEARDLEKFIMIIDNGLPTTGFLNLQNIHLTENSAENGNIERIVAELTSIRGIIPDLTGVTLKWAGLGNVANPQRLPSTIGVQLEELWRAVLHESGAIFDERDIRIRATSGNANIASEDEGGFPYVTTLFFDSFQPSHLVNLPPISRNEGETPSLPITSEQVSFIPDEAVFINEAVSRRILQEYANWLSRYFGVFPNSNVYVVGFQARTSIENVNRFDTRLSEQRAETVRNTLIDLGVPQARLITVGLGTNGGSHFRVDEFPDGVFNTVVAQHNRRVLLINDMSEDAVKLREIMEELK